MPTPFPARRLGAFVYGTARLSERGVPTYSPSGAVSGVTDLWTAVVPADRVVTPDELSGLPAIGSAHPVWGSGVELYALRVRDQEPGSRLRIVEAVYEQAGTLVDDPDPEHPTPPEERPKLVALDYPCRETSADLVADAITGDPVLNTAGDPFERVPARRILLPGVHWTWSWPAFPEAHLALSGTVNSAAIAIYGLAVGARRGLLRVTVRYEPDAASRPWVADYVVEVASTPVLGDWYAPSGAPSRYDAPAQQGGAIDVGWDAALLEVGYVYLDNGVRVRATELDEQGRAVAPSSPILLTSAGGRETGTGVGGGYLLVASVPGADWSALGAPEDAPEPEPEPEGGGDTEEP